MTRNPPLLVYFANIFKYETKEEVMQNISVYMNSRASNSQEEWREKISNGLFRSEIQYKAPNTIDELYEELDRDIKEEVATILSVGGDGTMNTLIQKLAGTDIALLVVPGGTANDLANTLGSNTSVNKIVQTIREDVKKRIDLVNINGRFMATNGGIGFASEVAREINDLRKKFPTFKNFMKLSGKNIYSLFLAKELLARDIISNRYNILCNEFTGEVNSPLVLVNNQPTLAGSFNIAPQTNHQDGSVNVTIFTHENRLELVQAILKILRNEDLSKDKKIISFETKNIKIDLLDEGSLSFFGDGEIFEEARSWNISVLEKGLSVYTPKGLASLENICTQVSLM